MPLDGELLAELRVASGLQMSKVEGSFVPPENELLAELRVASGLQMLKWRAVSCLQTVKCGRIKGCFGSSNVGMVKDDISKLRVYRQ